VALAAMDLVMNNGIDEGKLDIDALYREHGEFIGRTIGRLTGKGPHVDDLVQDSFLTAFKDRHRFDARLGEPRAWLYGIAANVCRHHKRGAWRRLRLQTRLAESHVDGEAVRPDGNVERNQKIELLRRFVGELPFSQREVFVLYEFERLEGKAIAELLGVPEGTVWTRLHHARKGFSKMLQRQGIEERAS
ncbi:MAG: hypothetical protein A2341_23815, partial [Deltaproteobacteria bacterium RIFOXYB12_FULL_58_9]